MRVRPWAVLSVMVFGCGGRIADDTVSQSNIDASQGSDAPPGFADASPAPPPPSSCTKSTVNMVKGSTGCDVSETWSCGSVTYGFSCLCPQGTCECWQDGTAKKLSGTLISCPSCVELDNASAVCGFPH